MVRWGTQTPASAISPFCIDDPKRKLQKKCSQKFFSILLKICDNERVSKLHKLTEEANWLSI